MKPLLVAVIILTLWGIRPAVAAPCPPEGPPTVVTTHLDIVDPADGVVSLREAVSHLIEHPSLPRTIRFSLPAAAPLTIALSSPLPPLNGDTLVILGGASNGNRIRLDGGGTHPLLLLSANSCLTLDSLILSHAHNPDGMGGAIHCQQSSLIITHCQFDSCTAAGMGGAIYAEQGSSLTLLHSHFLHNRALPMDGVYASGGAIAAINPTPLLAQNCAFTHNSAEYGGAIHIQGPTGSADYNIRFEISQCNFYADTAYNYGGALRVNYAFGWTHQCTFCHNHAGSGGAIYLQGNRRQSISSCTFVENNMTFTGGAALFADNNTDLALCNNLFARNNASGTTKDVRLNGNTSTASRGNIFTYTNILNIYNSRLSVPTSVNASLQVGANPTVVTIQGVPHRIYPPLRGSVAAEMGVAVGLLVSNPSTAAYWHSPSNPNSWCNGVSGNSVSGASIVIPDTLDEIGSHRQPPDSANSIGAIQRLWHQYDTVLHCLPTPYSYGGHTYTTPGDYLDTLYHSTIDTILHLHLLFGQPRDSIWYITACDSFTWYGHTYTANTYDTQLFPRSHPMECDSIAQLNLSILPSSHQSSIHTACDQYTWHGALYNTTGTYTYAYTNSDGCPSTDTLHLTINTSDTIT